MCVLFLLLFLKEMNWRVPAVVTQFLVLEADFRQAERMQCGESGGGGEDHKRPSEILYSEQSRG